MSRRCSSRGSCAGHAQHLVVAAGLVRHPEHADRAAADQAAGEGRLLQDHQRVQRVAVLAEGVLDEAVVGRVGGRGEQGAVQADPAGLVVDLVLVALALRDLHQYVELHRLFLPPALGTPLRGRNADSLAHNRPNHTSKGASSAVGEKRHWLAPRFLAEILVLVLLLAGRRGELRLRPRRAWFGWDRADPEDRAGRRTATGGPALPAAGPAPAVARPGKGVGVRPGAGGRGRQPAAAQAGAGAALRRPGHRPDHREAALPGRRRRRSHPPRPPSCSPRPLRWSRSVRWRASGRACGGSRADASSCSSEVATRSSPAPRRRPTWATRTRADVQTLAR